MGLIDLFYRYVFRENIEIGDEDYWTAFFNRKLSLYKEKGILDIDDWQETRYYNKLLLLLKEVLKIKSFKNLEVLELGSGTGILSILMAKEGALVTLIDKNKNALLYSKIIVRELRKRGKFIGRVKIVEGDIYDIEQKGNFDIVHNYGVIEHFQDKEIIRLLKIMKRHAKQDTGEVLSAVPNYFSPDTISIWLKYSKGNERYLSKRKLKILFKKSGFESPVCFSSRTVFPYFISKNICEKFNKFEDFIGQNLNLGFLYIALSNNNPLHNYKTY